MIKSCTRDETIFPKAPPMITPTAKSNTFPFKANFLKSDHIFYHPFLLSIGIKYLKYQYLIVNEWKFAVGSLSVISILLIFEKGFPIRRSSIKGSSWSLFPKATISTEPSDKFFAQPVTPYWTAFICEK